MKRTIKIGHTGITWPSALVDDAIRSIAELGYHGIELFGHDIESLETSDRSLAQVLEETGVPYVSSYCSAPLVDPDQRDVAVENCVRWAGSTKKLGGSIIVLGGDSVDRDTFTFSDHKQRIVETINAIGRRVSDIDVTCCFHPHTGTPVETEAEIRAVMDAIDSSVVKFAPDVGQIAKGGSDPKLILSDYLSLVQHLHLKDFVGGSVTWTADGKEVDRTGFVDYEILGRGVIDIGDMLDMLEAASFDGYAMVELDGTHFSATWDGPPPLPADEAARHAKEYLQGIGYRFRS